MKINLVVLGCLAGMNAFAADYAFVDIGDYTSFEPVVVNAAGDIGMYYGQYPAIFKHDSDVIQYFPDRNFLLTGIGTDARIALTQSNVYTSKIMVHGAASVVDYPTGQIWRIGSTGQAFVQREHAGFTHCTLAGQIVANYPAGTQLLDITTFQEQLVPQNMVGTAVLTKIYYQADPASIVTPSGVTTLPWSAVPTFPSMTLTEGYLSETLSAAGSLRGGSSFFRRSFYYSHGTMVEIPPPVAFQHQQVRGITNSGDAYGCDGVMGLWFRSQSAWRFVDGVKTPLNNLIDQNLNGYTTDIIFVHAVHPRGKVVVGANITGPSGTLFQRFGYFQQKSELTEVTLHATSEDYSGPWTGMDGTLELWQNGVLKGSRLVRLDPTGTYKFYELASGTYDLRFRTGRFLKRLKLGVTLSAGTQKDISFDLLGGDINGDNTVGRSDYLVLSAAFGKTSADSDWNSYMSNGYRPSTCDINFDGAVDMGDYLILAKNFDMSSDEIP